MDISILKELISQNLCIREMAEQLDKAPTTVRYWLVKHNLPTKKCHNSDRQSKICPKCKIEKDRVEFHKRRNGGDFSPYCKACTRIQTLDRTRELKIKCVEYSGGECQHCGYSKSLSALEFHHINPDKKDFAISKYKRYVFNEKVKKELDVCILLCSNCHREEHDRMYKMR